MFPCPARSNRNYRFSTNAVPVCDGLKFFFGKNNIRNVSFSNLCRVMLFASWNKMLMFSKIECGKPKGPCRDAITRVVFFRASVQMVWVATSRIIALMQNKKPIWNFPKFSSIGNSVHKIGMFWIAQGNANVTSRVGFNPCIPASILPLHN